MLYIYMLYIYMLYMYIYVILIYICYINLYMFHSFGETWNGTFSSAIHSPKCQCRFSHVLTPTCSAWSSWPASSSRWRSSRLPWLKQRFRGAGGRRIGRSLRSQVAAGRWERFLSRDFYSCKKQLKPTVVSSFSTENQHWIIIKSKKCHSFNH